MPQRATQLCGRDHGRGERLPGPICPDTLAKNIVRWNLRDLEVVFNGTIRALAKVGGFGAKVTGIADSTALEMTLSLESALLIDDATKIPLAVKMRPIQEHEALWMRALVTEARLNLQGEARLHKMVFDRGFWDGPRCGGWTSRS